jgi:uncharacterized Ntn-hydrolase superfamily protein
MKRIEALQSGGAILLHSDGMKTLIVQNTRQHPATIDIYMSNVQSKDLEKILAALQIGSSSGWMRAGNESAIHAFFDDLDEADLIDLLQQTQNSSTILPS